MEHDNDFIQNELSNEFYQDSKNKLDENIEEEPELQQNKNSQIEEPEVNYSFSKYVFRNVEHYYPSRGSILEKIFRLV